MPDIAGNLGQARGSVVIDTSSAERAAVTVRKVGQDIKNALSDTGNLGQRISSGFSSIGGSLRNLGNDIRAIRTELVAVGLAAGALTKIGLDGAKSIRAYRVTFSNLLGDEQKALGLMEELTTQANAFGIEVTEVWQLARALLPALEGDTDQLDEFVKRAALLASTNPLKSTADAARAIQEYLAGQTISLQRLFNVDPNVIQEAQMRFQGVGDQLDYILGRMGATEEGARAMADSFVGVKNELKLLLAEGFTPLFQQLQPFLVRVREVISEVRLANPAFLSFGAGLTAIVAVGAPTLIFLGQVISALEKIRTLSATAALGRVGVLAGAAIGGAAIGNAIGRGIGTLTGNEAVANTQLSDVGNVIKQLLFLAADSLTKLIVIVQDLVLRAVQAFVNGVAGMVSSMAGFVRVIGQLLPDVLGGDKLTSLADNLQAFSDGLKEAAEQGRQILGQALMHGREELLTRLQDFLFPTPAKASGTTTGGASTPADSGGFTDEQTEAIVSWWERIRQIEEQQAQARLEATEQYEEQRAELINNYGKQMAREEEDFLRQRQRQNEQFARAVAQITAERIKREQDWLNDLNERIAELRSDTVERIAELRQESNERLQEIEEDYQRERERAAAEHQNNLLDAASRLDARAIAQEQRRFELQQREAERDHRERISDEQEGLQKRIDQEQKNLEERIAQEQKAHQERIQAAREADEERIEDMREALAEQQRIEDEDRAIRLRRIEEDHQRQLDALEETNRKRLVEIDLQAGKELNELDRKFNKELIQLGLANEALLTLQKKAQNDALEAYQKYWDDWNKVIEDQKAINPLKDQDKQTDKVPGAQGGGAIGYTGMTMLHGTRGRPEYVLSPDTTAALRGMLGNFNQSQLLTAVSGGRSSSIVIADGAIRVYGAPGQSEEAIGAAVRNELMGLFQGVIG